MGSVQSKTFSGSPSTTIGGTWANNTTTGNTILLVFGSTNASLASVSSITDSQSNTYTKVDSSTNTIDGELWMAANITGGTTPTVTVTISGVGSTGVDIVMEEWSGLIASPLDKHTVTTGTSTALASGNTATTTQAQEVVIGWGVSAADTSALTIGTGFINLQNSHANNSTGLEQKYVYSTGAQSAAFTGSSAAWVCGVATFKTASTPFVQTAGINGGSPQTVTPAQTATLGNLMILGVTVVSTTGTITVPSGFTAVGTAATQSTTSMTQMYYKISLGNETSFQVSWSGSGNVRVVYAEYSSYTILDKTTTSGTASANSLATGSITPVIGKFLAIAIFGITGSGTNILNSLTNDFGLEGNSGSNQTVAADYFTISGSGAYSTTLTYGTAAVATSVIADFIQIVNASLSQVGATLTFTGGTQSDVAIQDSSISQVGATLTFTGGTQSTALQLPQSAATLTFTGGTQAVASVQDTSIAQAGATLTFSGGTQVASAGALISATIYQLSAIDTWDDSGRTWDSSYVWDGSVSTGASLTATGGTQSIATVNDISITQVAANVTASGGTQSVTTGSIINASVTQVGASITLTGGTQVVQTNASIAQSAANLTFTGGTQSVSTVNIVAISQSHATLTLTGGSQGIQDIQDSQIAQVGANLTLSGGTQTVATINDVSISQTHATLTLTGGTQSIATVNDVAISQVGANLTLTGGTQSVVAGSVSNVSITQVGASLTFTGGTQSVLSINDVTISQTHASLTFTGGSQGIQDIQDSQITQVGTALTFTGGTQSIATQNFVAISQSAATLSLTGGSQSIVAIIVASASITQTYAILTLTGGTQSIAAIIISKANTWTPEVIYPDSWSSIGDPNPDTWLVNPQGVIDTWDDADREWDSDYTWDGITSQAADAIISSWTASEPVASNWQSESVSTSSWTEV